MPHISRFLSLHCLLIDSSCHSPQISDSSPSLLGSRNCPFHPSTLIPPWCFLFYSTGWTEDFPFFVPFYLFSYYCLFSSTYAALYSFCSSLFCFSISQFQAFLHFPYHMLYCCSLLRKHCPLLSSVFIPLYLHSLHSIKVTTSFGIVHPSMHIAAPLGDSPLTPLCFFIFSHTFYGGAISSLLFLFSLRHSHFLCPSSPHLKHFTVCSTTSCLLTFLTPHCITRFFNTSNLFPTAISFFSSFPLLYFWARCLNLPHHLHNLPSLPSNSALNLVRARLSLSMSLISLLFWSRDIVLCSGRSLSICKRKGVYLLRVCLLLLRAHSMSAGAYKSSLSQVPTALLTTALIILWLSLHGGDLYSDCLLKNMTIFLCID